MAVRDVIVIKNVPVKDNAAEHGRDIGYIYGAYEGFHCSMDFDAEHDGWIPMVNPPTWRDTGKRGWLKKSWCIADDPGETKLLVTVYSDGRAPTVKVVA